MARTQAELEAYLEKKLAKHAGQLSEARTTALWEAISQQRVKHISDVRDKYTAFAKMEDGERKEAALQQRLDKLAQEREKKIQRARVFIGDAPPTLEMVRKMADQIDELGRLEVMQVTTTGSRVLRSADKLRKSADDLEEKVIGKILDILVRDCDAAMKARNADKVEKLLADADKGIDKLIDTYYVIGSSAKEAARTAVTTMSDQAVKAWVKKNPDKFSRIISKLNEASNSVIEVGEEAGRPVPGLPEALKGFRVFKQCIIDRQVEAALAKRQMGKEKGKNVAGLGFDLADQYPTLMAERVAQKQIANLKQILTIIGAVVSEFFPPWKPLGVVLEQTGTAYFNQRVKLAAEEVKKNPPPLAKTDDPDSDEEFEEVIEEISEKFEDAAFEAFKSAATGETFFEVMEGALGEFSPENVSKELLGKATGMVMELLMKHMPVEPGQVVTGAQLRADALALKAGATISKKGDPELDYQHLGRPTEDNQGRAIKRFMQSNMEIKDDKRWFWVEIEDEIGKLYMPDRDFVADPGGSLNFPTHVNGREITEIIGPAPSGEEGAWLEVRIDDLIGFVDAAQKTFTPVRPAKLADWQSRRIARNPDRYQEGRTQVTGTWTRVKPRPGKGNHEFYLFEHDGQREWGDAESPTDNLGDKMREVFADSKLPTKVITELA